MTKEYRYLSDEELEAMIAGVEEREMIASPVYLKKLIMDEALKQVSEAPKVQIVSYKERKAAANRQLIFYSAKIISAAAVAVFCLLAVPMNLSGGHIPYEAGNRIERQVEKDMEWYRQEAEQVLKQKPDDKSSLEQIIFNKSEEIFGWIHNKKNNESMEE